MSLTAHILFGLETRMPTGRRIEHLMERQKQTNPGCARNAEIREANIGRVFASVADGCDTVNKIMDRSGLSKSTVQKALNILEGRPSGERIVRIMAFPAHRYEVAK